MLAGGFVNRYSEGLGPGTRSSVFTGDDVVTSLLDKEDERIKTNGLLRENEAQTIKRLSTLLGLCCRLKAEGRQITT